MTTLHFKQDVQTTLNSCHQKPNIYLIYVQKLESKIFKKEVAMVNTSRMLASTNEKETIKIPTALSSQNYIAQILFLTTTHNRHRLNPDLSCLPQCKGINNIINNIVLICSVQTAYSVDERKQEQLYIHRNW